MAGYNYGYHREKVEKEFVQIASICRAKGIAEETIGHIYRMMLDILNSDRKFYNKTLSYDGTRLPDGSDTSAGSNLFLLDYLVLHPARN